MKECPNCGKEVKNKRNKFCNNSCSASYNNRGVRRHGDGPYTKECLYCKEQFEGIKTRKYCSSKCQQAYQKQQYIERWQAGEEDGISSGISTSSYIRKYIFEKYDNKCVECGWSKINPYSGKIPLQLEHIDGNWKNNKEENLTLLCPSCHSLTPTFGALNKGNGRENRH